MTSGPEPLELDLGTVARAIGRGWARIVIGVILGVITAAIVVLFVPARFEGRSLVLIRTPQDASGVLKQRLGPLAELAPSAMGLGSKNDIETELALMQSRSVLGRVVDSLRLQAWTMNPGRIPSSRIVDSLHLTGRFKPRKVALQAGRNDLPEGSVWGSATEGQGAQVKLYDREDAIDELADHLEVRTQGGDVVRIRYRGLDSLTAARVPNLVVDIYLARRHTTDRGLNQRRLEFLVAKGDSVNGDLRRAARDLRDTQEMQKLFDAEPEARAIFERLATLETTLAEIRADQATLDSVLARSGRPGFDPRLVAGVPSLLKSPAVNEIVSQLEKTEGQRGALLAQYADDAPAVVALARVADSLRAVLVPLARTFGESLVRQRASLERDLATIQAHIDALPGKSESVGLRQASLKQVALLSAGMGSQLLEARLAAITEGGDVRLVDEAVAPRKVAFPRPSMTFAICIPLGFALGLSAALLRAPRTNAA